MNKREFLIKIFIGGLLHKPFFIVLILQGEMIIIIRPTKKLVTSYVVKDLTFLN